MIDNFLLVAVLASVYTLFALGMSLVWGSIGVLNFAHGSIFMFSSFVAYIVTKHVDLPIVATVVLAVVVGATLSVLTEALAFDPIKRRAKTPHDAELQILIAGIGIATLLLAIAQRETKSNPFGIADTTVGTGVHELGGVRVTSVELAILASAVVLSVAIIWWLRSSRTGLALRAIGVDPETAALMGMNRRFLSYGTMALAGGLAGLAGILLTLHLSAITPESGDGLLVKAFAATILGGIGSLTGTVAGCVILATGETVVLTQTSGQWVDAVSFAVIIIVLLVSPNGLLGRSEVRRV